MVTNIYLVEGKITRHTL